MYTHTHTHTHTHTLLNTPKFTKPGESNCPKCKPGTETERKRLSVKVEQKEQNSCRERVNSKLE